MVLPSRIESEALQQLPLGGYEGPIRHIVRDEDVAAAAKRLAADSLLGFDIETKPSFRAGENHPPALLQLASADEVYVFQLTRLRDVGPLYKLLSNPAVTKAGVALRDDIKKLREREPFEPRAFVELSTMSKSVGIEQTGLRPLSALLFGFRVSKREQRSNWGRHELTDSQIRYAATDAWVSRKIFLRLKELGAAVAPYEFQSEAPPARNRPPRRRRRRPRSGQSAPTPAPG